MIDGLMPLERAMPIADAGGRIRRHGWMQGWTAGMHEGVLTYHDPDGRRYGPVTMRDRARRDWGQAKAWSRGRVG